MGVSPKNQIKHVENDVKQLFQAVFLMKMGVKPTGYP